MFPPLAQIAGYEYRVNEGSAVDVGMDLDALIMGLKAGTNCKGEARAYDTRGLRSRWTYPPAFASTFLFTDDFNDGVIDPAKWIATDSADIHVVEQGGNLQFLVDSAYSGSVNGASLNAAKLYDLRGRSAEVSIVSATIGASSGGGFGMYDTANGYNSASITFEGVPGRSIYFSRRNGSYADNDQLMKAFPSMPAKWKIKHNIDGNTWSFFTYTAGVWTLEFTSLPASWQPTNAYFGLNAYTYFSSAANKNLIFDDFIVR